MEQYTPRVGNMADPFTLNALSPASAPTPSNREADLTANGLSSRGHHSADSTPSARSSSGHARTRHSPLDGFGDANIIQSIIHNLSQDDLVEFHRLAESHIRERAQLSTAASRSQSRIRVAASQDILFTPDLSPDASTHTSVSIDTPSPVRADRVGQEITNDNAQGYYPAQACLYIGNLPTLMSDGAIRLQVQAAYSAMHECYVTVSRDRAGLASAFVQFTRSEHADNALDQTSTISIGGRIPRAERTKANFALIATMTRPLTDTDLKSRLHELGPLDQIWRPTPTEYTYFDLPVDCVCFRFVHFADFQDVRSGVKTAPGVNIRSMTKCPTPNHARNRAPNETPCRYIRMSNVTSVFVGNLPCDCSTPELHATFAAGRVINVQRFNTADQFSKRSFFAFVEFQHPQGVAAAIKTLNGTMLRGSRMRVELRTDVKREVERIRGEMNTYVADTFARTGFWPDHTTVLSAFPDLLGTSLALANGTFRRSPVPLISAIPYYVLEGI